MTDEERRERTPTPLDTARVSMSIDDITQNERVGAEERGKIRLLAVANAAARVMQMCLTELHELEMKRADWAVVRGHIRGTFQRRATDLERLETLLYEEMP